jgi:hypothetical protein
MLGRMEFHTAVLGLTGSGKTHAAKCIARSLRRAGWGTIVLHKPGEHWGDDCASWKTDDPQRFARQYWRCRNVAAFMELADADVPKYDEEFRAMFTRGRHEGRHNFYLSQRAAQVHPDIRENCKSLLLFMATKNGAKLWADEKGDERLLNLPIPLEIIPPEIKAHIDPQNPPRGAMGLPPFWFLYKPAGYIPARLLTFKQ